MKKLISIIVFYSLMSGCISLPNTVETDEHLAQIELGGTTFHSQTFGNANNPVVIVLHGGPGADYRYLLNLQSLADEYFVVFYDQRGTGLSVRVPKKEITLDQFIDDLDLFVDHYGKNKPVNLIGHSWGAMLASAYVGTYPKKVRKIVLAEPAFLNSDTSAELFAKGGWPGFRVVWGFSKAWVGKWFVKAKGDEYAREDYFLEKVMPLFQMPEELCEGKLPELHAWRFGASNFQATIGRMLTDREWANDLDFSAGVDHYQGDALFVTGACNTLQGEDYQRRLMKPFRHASIAVIPKAGHFMFNEQPEISTSVVRVFFNQ